VTSQWGFALISPRVKLLQELLVVFYGVEQKMRKPFKPQAPKEIKKAPGQNADHTRKRHLRMPKEDEFRWLINRYFDQKNPETHQDCVPEAEAIKAWLKREKYGRSWKEIARNVYKARRPDDIPAMISRAFRAHEKVERYLIEGKTHLTGHQAYLKRKQKEWEERYFAPGYFD
jgi:hypothetical protein